jgi:hypothetical protein
MPKTYTAIPSVSTGDVYQAAAHNNIATTINNIVVPSVCFVSRASAQSINNSTWSFVSFTTEVIDNDGCFAATDSKITIQTAGVYSVSASTAFASNATGNRMMLIETNAASAATGTIQTQIAQVACNGVSTNSTVATLIDCAASTTIHVSVWQSSGGALNATDSTLRVAWVGNKA